MFKAFGEKKTPLQQRIAGRIHVSYMKCELNDFRKFCLYTGDTNYSGTDVHDLEYIKSEAMRLHEKYSGKSNALLHDICKINQDRIAHGTTISYMAGASVLWSVANYSSNASPWWGIASLLATGILSVISKLCCKAREDTSKTAMFALREAARLKDAALSEINKMVMDWNERVYSTNRADN